MISIFRLMNNRKFKVICSLFIVIFLLFSSKGVVKKYRGFDGFARMFKDAGTNIHRSYSQYKKASSHKDAVSEFFGVPAQETLNVEVNNNDSVPQDIKTEGVLECGNYAVIRISLESNIRKNMIKTGYVGKDFSRLINMLIYNKEVGHSTIFEAPQNMIGLYESNNKNINGNSTKYIVTIEGVGDKCLSYEDDLELFNCY